MDNYVHAWYIQFYLILSVPRITVITQIVYFYADISTLRQKYWIHILTIISCYDCLFGIIYSRKLSPDKYCIWSFVSLYKGFIFHHDISEFYSIIVKPMTLWNRWKWALSSFFITSWVWELIHVHISLDMTIMCSSASTFMAWYGKLMSPQMGFYQADLVISWVMEAPCLACLIY